MLQHVLTSAEEIVNLLNITWDLFLSELKDRKIHEIVAPVPKENLVECWSLSTMDDSVLETDKQTVRCSRLGRLKSSPFYEVLWEHRGVFPTEVLNHLPADRGIHHELDLGSGTKYCVTRQWSLPKEQVDYID